MKEKNIKIYNKDVKQTGHYLYTGDDRMSLRIATGRQSAEILKIMSGIVNNSTRILDIGCGDGSYTIELFKSLKPKFILGIDPSIGAISSAKNKTPKRYVNKIRYRKADVYQLDQIIKKGQFDVIIARGVLHHLYKPEAAIKKISKFANSVVILEPNGFNPVLKIIEKVSSYHRLHEEKSYWPPKLDRWFMNSEYDVKYKKYFSIIPYFFPDVMTKVLKTLEPFLERIPIMHKIYCGSLLILYEKNSS